MALPGFAEHEKIVRGFYRASKVGHRHLVLPLDAYAGLRDFGTANDTFIDNAVELGCAQPSRLHSTRPVCPPPMWT